MRREIDRVIHAADARLALPLLQGQPPQLALGTDWTWRPDAWHGSLPLPGLVAGDKATQVSEDLGLYHDCPLSEIALRQVSNGMEARAPFGLVVEVFMISISVLKHYFILFGLGDWKRILFVFVNCFISR